jgi:hypothetical protein
MVFICLHCKDPFVISRRDFNCKILRHGVMKDTMKPMDPHAHRTECERLVREGLIYGCGKPMRIVVSGNEYVLEICEYI